MPALYVAADHCSKQCGKYSYAPVCDKGGKEHHNSCYAKCSGCQQYDAKWCRPKPVPAPKPSPSPSPSPSGRCDYPYKTMTYTNSSVRHTYVMYDVDAIRMLKWWEAKEWCECKGGELAPWSEPESLGESAWAAGARRMLRRWPGGRRRQSWVCLVVCVCACAAGGGDQPLTGCASIGIGHARCLRCFNSSTACAGASDCGVATLMGESNWLSRSSAPPRHGWPGCPTGPSLALLPVMLPMLGPQMLSPGSARRTSSRHG